MLFYMPLLGQRWLPFIFYNWLAFRFFSFRLFLVLFDSLDRSWIIFKINFFRFHLDAWQLLLFLYWQSLLWSIFLRVLIASFPIFPIDRWLTFNIFLGMLIMIQTTLFDFIWHFRIKTILLLKRLLILQGLLPYIHLEPLSNLLHFFVRFSTHD